jgi:hypothetical protein
MKTSSAADARQPLDRPTAWAFTVTNLATLPGLGSIAAGRRVGWPQAMLALAGFGLTLWGLVRTVLEWVAAGELPVGITKPLLISLAGLAGFAAAWLWALATSLSLLREARENERTANSTRPDATLGA